MRIPENSLAITADAVWPEETIGRFGLSEKDITTYQQRLVSEHLDIFLLNYDLDSIMSVAFWRDEPSEEFNDSDIIEKILRKQGQEMCDELNNEPGELVCHFRDIYQAPELTTMIIDLVDEKYPEQKIRSTMYMNLGLGRQAVAIVFNAFDMKLTSEHDAMAKRFLDGLRFGVMPPDSSANEISLAEEFRPDAGQDASADEPAGAEGWPGRAWAMEKIGLTMLIPDNSVVVTMDEVWPGGTDISEEYVDYKRAFLANAGSEIIIVNTENNSNIHIQVVRSPIIGAEKYLQRRDESELRKLGEEMARKTTAESKFQTYRFQDLHRTDQDVYLVFELFGHATDIHPSSVMFMTRRDGNTVLIYQEAISGSLSEEQAKLGKQVVDTFVFKETAAAPALEDAVETGAEKRLNVEEGWPGRAWTIDDLSLSFDIPEDTLVVTPGQVWPEEMWLALGYSKDDIESHKNSMGLADKQFILINPWLDCTGFVRALPESSNLGIWNLGDISPDELEFLVEGMKNEIERSMGLNVKSSDHIAIDNVTYLRYKAVDAATDAGRTYLMLITIHEGQPVQFEFSCEGMDFTTEQREYFNKITPSLSFAQIQSDADQIYSVDDPAGAEAWSGRSWTIEKIGLTLEVPDNSLVITSDEVWPAERVDGVIITEDNIEEYRSFMNLHGFDMAMLNFEENCAAHVRIVQGSMGSLVEDFRTMDRSKLRKLGKDTASAQTRAAPFGTYRFRDLYDVAQHIYIIVDFFKDDSPNQPFEVMFTTFRDKYGLAVNIMPLAGSLTERQEELGKRLLETFVFTEKSQYSSPAAEASGSGASNEKMAEPGVEAGDDGESDWPGRSWTIDNLSLTFTIPPNTVVVTPQEVWPDEKWRELGMGHSKEVVQAQKINLLMDGRIFYFANNQLGCTGYISSSTDSAYRDIWNLSDLSARKLENLARDISNGFKGEKGATGLSYQRMEIGGATFLSYEFTSKSMYGGDSVSLTLVTVRNGQLIQLKFGCKGTEMKPEQKAYFNEIIDSLSFDGLPPKSACPAPSGDRGGSSGQKEGTSGLVLVLLIVIALLIGLIVLAVRVDFQKSSPPSHGDQADKHVKNKRVSLEKKNDGPGGPAA